jgi:outer membrane protein assembly factor BamE (lipoprotein component of BamABCDE complex)
LIIPEKQKKRGVGMYKEVFSLLIIVLMAILLSGCVLKVESDNHTSSDRWYDSDVATIQRGKITSDQVLSGFGRPGKRIGSDSGNEVWRYTYSDKAETEVGFIFLFHIDVEDETNHELNIEFKNNVVENFWTSRY